MLSFTKMHGLGNDFIVIDNRTEEQTFTSDRIRALADRRLGVGFDQLLVVEKPSIENVEFDYRIYNADGGEVEHCGNGARCFAWYVRDRGMTQSERIRVNTQGGVIELRIREDEQVTVDVGVPTFIPEEIPLAMPKMEPVYSVKIGEDLVEFGAVAIGNPHAVIQVNDVDTAPVDSWGPILERHSIFPNRVNVGFMEIINRQHIRLRVYERGVGETMACGTGACAAVAIGRQKKLLDKNVIVTLSGGDLSLFWPDVHANIEMTGPCTKVFEGQTRM